jgi:drug/metabolite transporter (DMT)-like permease
VTREPREPWSAAALGTLMVLVSAVCFSAKAIFAKLAYRYGVDADTVITLRMLFALPFFAAAGFVSSARARDVPLTARERLRIALLGSLGYYLASWLDFQGLVWVSAGLERLILFLYPTLVILLNVVLRLERVDARVGRSLLLCYGGVALVVYNDRLSGGSNVPLGSALVFAGALVYAGYLVFSQPLLLRHGSTRITSWTLVATTFAALAEFAAAGRFERLMQPAPVLWLCAATALVATVAPAFLLAAGMRRLGTSRASVLATVGPVSTLLLAYWFLDEPLTLVQLVGSSLVLLGVWNIGRDKQKARLGSALTVSNR